MSFFVTSAGSGKGANLGGIQGADRHCQALATAVKAGDRTWRAYLSVTDLKGKGAINARDRIGTGPWHNAKGVRIARNVDDLHSASNNITRETALTEKGAAIPPKPNVHDIITGSTEDGRAWNYNLLDTLNLENGAMTCNNSFGMLWRRRNGRISKPSLRSTGGTFPCIACPAAAPFKSFHERPPLCFRLEKPAAGHKF